MTIPQPFLQELLTRVDIVDVVGRYVPLKKGGANLMGLCPFHGEKSPSFSVSAAKQFFHCFGCGKSGNAITFLMEHTGIGFVQAVQELAQGVGLHVPQEHTPSAQAREHAAAQRQQHMQLADILEQAGAAWRQHLKNTPHAIDYLKQRGISGASAQRYALGYAPQGWHNLASVFAQYDHPVLEEAGLVIVQPEEERRYDRFRHRIMFPIRNVKGQYIGFGGRVLNDEKPKYLNSPQTAIFHKGHELYGLFEARTAIREQGYALVTEGYMDVLALAQSGFANTVATLGTACTSEHLHKLFRFTDQIIFSFDGDPAGRRAARKALDAALPHMGDTRSVKFVFLPSEHDPDSFIRAHGPAAFAHSIRTALPLSRFWLDAASDGHDLSLAEGRSRMAHNAYDLWYRLPDSAFKHQLLNALEQHTQMSRAQLLDLWHKRGGPHSSPSTTAPNAQQPSTLSNAPPNTPIVHAASTMRARHEPRPKMPRRSATAHATGMGHAPVSRADQAARLLLSHMVFWEDLSPEEQDALCSQAPPHDALFAWLETQRLEYGPQPWALLRERLRGQACEDLALRLMDGPHAQPEGDIEEIRYELRGVLDRIVIERLKTRERHIIDTLASDPQAAQQLRQLQTRRILLQTRVAQKDL